MFASFFTWDGWSALVAIGTLTLAGVTLAVAIVAVRGNQVARRGVAIGEAELQTSMLPVLEAVPAMPTAEREDSMKEVIDYTNVGFSHDERWTEPDWVDVLGERGAVYCSIPVQNVGQGIARISSVRPRALSVPDVIWTDGEPTRALIPAGQRARLQFRLSGVRDEIYAEVFYTDFSGEQPARTRLYVRRQQGEAGHSTYVVRGTAIYSGGDDEPFAVAGDARVTANQPSPPPTLALNQLLS
ncbi:MAG TPA: hypothetical protein VNC40_03305 [Gaiellaceae bacterium]|nr:hypothetical protein [Gaiellaceae bacterium]